MPALKYYYYDTIDQGCGVGVGSRWSRMLSAGVGVGFQNCWSRSRFFKTAGVGVGFLKLLESESVFQNCWSRSRFFKTAGVGTFVAIADTNVY